MTSFEIGLIIVVIYICLYGLVNRICKCVEACMLGKTYNTFLKNKKEKEN